MMLNSAVLTSATWGSATLRVAVAARDTGGL